MMLCSDAVIVRSRRHPDSKSKQAGLALFSPFALPQTLIADPDNGIVKAPMLFSTMRDPKQYWPKFKTVEKAAKKNAIYQTHRDTQSAFVLDVGQ